MTIASRLRLGMFLLAFIPAIAIGALVGWSAVTQAQLALHAQAEARLVSVREERATQIERYFDAMNQQVLVTANTISTQRALDLLTRAFHAFPSSLSVDVEQERKRLLDYYKGAFTAEYTQRNAGATSDVAGYVGKLDEAAVLLQTRFIRDNPHPLGAKDRLLDLADGSDYARMHNRFHPSFHNLQQRFGYYDIFLIDAATGHVVYSVFKETDFATSLQSGPVAQSGLAQAYRDALAIDDPNTTTMTDFAAYLPSYEDPAAFVGAPVFDAGKKIGVIVFQLPVDRIKAVMTGDQRWRESGLGDSGETYLVGADSKMRSESRFLVEDPEGFVAQLREAGVDSETVNRVASKQTVIGVKQVDSPGSRRALAGETGFEIFADYRGVEVLSAFKPVDILGQRWAILAEIDTAEAFSAATELQSSMIVKVAGGTAVIVLISLVVGYLFARSISGPLDRITRSMQNIATGDGDLTVRLDASRSDELGILAAAFNQFVERIDTLVQRVKHSASGIAAASRQLTTVTDDTRAGVARQQAEIEHIATAVEEMTSTVREVAQSASSTAQAAQHAGGQVDTGRTILGKTLDSSQSLASRMQESQAIIDALSDDSDKVGTVLEVIRSIAEQTNLLALNAAIEAARAGEQGRGFAVVADEVRVLAQRTQESTEEIRVIVESLQSRSNETTAMLSQNNQELQENVALSESTEQAFAEITSAVNQLLDMSAQIASATEEQSAATEEIGRNVHVIHDASLSTTSGADQTAAASKELAMLGEALAELVDQFRVSA